MRTNKIKLEVHRGEGYEFLKGFDSSFKRAQVKIVLHVRTLWPKQQGMKWKVVLVWLF